MIEFRFYKITDVQDMVQLLEWLPEVDEEIEFVEREFRRIMAQEGRSAIPVKYANRITLYVNDMTGRD